MAGRDVFLITVDPVAGTAVQTAVTGAKDFPVGMAMGPDGTATSTSFWDRLSPILSSHLPHTVRVPWSS